jgi:hypothetical protein
MSADWQHINRDLAPLFQPDRFYIHISTVVEVLTTAWFYQRWFMYHEEHHIITYQTVIRY